MTFPSVTRIRVRTTGNIEHDGVTQYGNEALHFSFYAPPFYDFAPVSVNTDLDICP
ncbi:hypothetical protein B0G77_8681 [Paraburkholderia sp. BL10I2N1]|nr:hypothetical protein B0G77_8681 [Paraburkholderia sp. BL10I2N1]